MFEALKIETAVVEEADTEGVAYSEGAWFCAGWWGWPGQVKAVAEKPEEVETVLVNGLSHEGLKTAQKVLHLARVQGREIWSR